MHVLWSSSYTINEYVWFCQLYKLIITIKNYFDCSFPTEPRDCPASKPRAQCLPMFSVHSEAQAVWRWVHVSPTCSSQNLLLSTSGVLPWRAPSPGLVLLPSLLLSSETGVMCGFWSIIPVLGWELESPLQTVNMFLSTFHRMYWRRGTKFRLSTKPNWKLWLWERKIAPRSGQLPTKAGLKAAGSHWHCCSLRFRLGSCHYQSVVLFVCLWLEFVIVFTEGVGIIRNIMVGTNVQADNLTLKLVIYPPLPGTDLEILKPRLQR